MNITGTEEIEEALISLNSYIETEMSDILDNYGGICIHTKDKGAYKGISLANATPQGNVYMANTEFKNTAYLHIKSVVPFSVNEKEYYKIATVEMVLMTSIERAGQNYKTFENAIEVEKRLKQKYKRVSLSSDPVQPEFIEQSTIQIDLNIFAVCTNVTTKTASPC